MTIIQTLAESNFRASGLPMSIIDALTHPYLLSAGWQDNLHEVSPANTLSHARCLESDAYVRDQLDEGETCQYKCKNGLGISPCPLW